jgi:hypothetical protein
MILLNVESYPAGKYLIFPPPVPNSDASSNPGTPCLLIDRSVWAKQMEWGEVYEEDGRGRRI